MSSMDSARIHRHTHILIVLLTVVATLLAVYVWQHPRQTVAQDTPRSQAMSSLPDFTEVAAKVTPAAVNISTNRKVQVPTMPDSGGGDFFGPFFRGDSPFQMPTPPTPRQQQPQQYEEMPATGSGFIVRPDGYIITNNHVVANADEIKVKLESGKEYKATIKGTDPRTELAVIKIDAGDSLPTLPLGDSDAVKVGQWVLAVGSPFEYQSTVTAGIISAKGRSLPAETGPYAIMDLLQTDAAINPGNSGGPLVNLNGQVIGVDVAIAGPIRGNVGIGFAIPVNQVKAVVDDLIAGKRIVRGWLGIGITDLTDETRKATKADQGVYVREVQAGSPADAAQLEPGDVVTAFNGQKVSSADELSKAAAATKPGTTVRMDITRSGETKTLEIEVGKMPDRYAGFNEGKPQQPGEQPSEPSGATALGMTVQGIDAQARQAYKLPRTVVGVVVTGMDPQGPAAAADMQEGDVILKVNGQDVKSLDDYQAAVKGVKGSVNLVIRHDEDGQIVKRIVTIKLPQ